MAKRFFNCHIPMVRDRSAVAIDEIQLRDMIVGEGLNIIKTYTKDKQDEFATKVQKYGNEQLLKECIVAILNDHDQIRADMWFDQKTLIVGINPKDTIVAVNAGNGGSPRVGYHECKNKVAYFGVIAHSARQGKSYFVTLYCDGQDLRAYVPLRGNLINVDCKSIFGDELESGVFDAKALEMEYRALGIYSDKTCWHRGIDKPDWYSMYVVKNGYKTSGRIKFNWDAIFEELENKFIPLLI